MADKRRTVTLVAPDGTETQVSDPTGFYNLVYACGYRPRTGTLDEAAAALTQPSPVPPSAAVPQPIAKGGTA